MIFIINIPYAEYQSDMGIYRAVDKQFTPKRPKKLLATEEEGERMRALLQRYWDHTPSNLPEAAAVLIEENCSSRLQSCPSLK